MKPLPPNAAAALPLDVPLVASPTGALLLNPAPQVLMWTRDWKRAQELAWLVATEYGKLLLQLAEPLEGVADWLQVGVAACRGVGLPTRVVGAWRGARSLRMPAPLEMAGCGAGIGFPCSTSAASCKPARPRAAPMLRSLQLMSKTKVPCALVTSMDRHTTDALLEKLHLRHHFSVLVTGELSKAPPRAPGTEALRCCALCLLSCS